MPEETILYEQGDIKITNLRAVFGNKTYAISNITSVEKGSIPPSNGLALILIIVGVMFSFLAFIANASVRLGMLLLGVVMALGGFGSMFLGSKTEYYVQFASSAGEVRAYSSDNQNEIESIVKAINNAIVQKG